MLSHDVFRDLLICQYFSLPGETKILQTNYLRNWHKLGFVCNDFLQNTAANLRRTQ
jgi:hypothetical protein